MLNPDKSTLKFPIETCENCGLTLTGKVTPHIENGFNEDRSPRLTGFCPKCGRGYAMLTIEPVIVEAVVETPPAPPAPADGLEDMDYYDLRAMGKTLGIENRMKKPELIKAIREAKRANAGGQPKS